MANYTIQNETFNLPKLTYIKTSPNNVVLKVINDNVTNTNLYGINSGFFYGNDLLSIAVNNDVPAQRTKNDYGSGWENIKYARGTLVWDRTARKYSVQVVSKADELEVSDRSAYWAQGGISMSLQDDTNWQRIAQEQNMPNMTGNTTRSAVVYNSGLNLYLVATETLCTAEEFRNAIKLMANGSIIDGIFLDGGGSTQMKCWGVSIDGDGRKVIQMIALINK